MRTPEFMRLLRYDISDMPNQDWAAAYMDARSALDRVSSEIGSDAAIMLELYYVEEIPQETLANMFATNQAGVSRLLCRALEIAAADLEA